MAYYVIFEIEGENAKYKKITSIILHMYMYLGKNKDRIIDIFYVTK